jgi:hypothetical protein
MTLDVMVHFICILAGLAGGILLGRVHDWGTMAVCAVAAAGLAVGWLVGFGLSRLINAMIDATPLDKTKTDKETTPNNGQNRTVEPRGRGPTSG